MLKFNNPLAFAINSNAADANSLEYAKFEGYLVALSANIPGFVAEGIGNLRRQPKTETNVSIALSPFGIAIDAERIEKERIICVGVSEKYDVSLEAIDDISRPFIIGRMSKIPVLDLKKDFNLVVAKLKKYLLDAYGEKEAQPQIVYHSQFMRIGDRIVRYSDTCACAAIKREQEESRKLNEVIALFRALSV